MSVFDNLKGKAADLKAKAAGMVDQHSDKIEQGVAKAAAVADEKTGGKYRDKIDAGVDKVKSGLDSLDGQQDDFEAPSAATTPGAPAATSPVTPASTAGDPFAPPAGTVPAASADPADAEQDPFRPTNPA
ncbi:MAG TPA: antitoxin [Dermatophilaceae bacterium]|nr:antitoxin [Dermatophilaceae bacterium]